jgi:NitT/TauT family transport system substrate-binding protein
MTSSIRRREFVAGLGAGLLAAPAIVRAQGQPIVIRAGALKLIHSIAPYFYDQFLPAGYQIEVLPFETPTECKNAVVTKSVDFGAFGIAAAWLGAAAGEPVVVIASTCNRGTAIIAKKDSGIAAIKDLKGKRGGGSPRKLRMVAGGHLKTPVCGEPTAGDRVGSALRGRIAPVVASQEHP